jgi:metal-responsive CopG/Arc/MetJ family transcriptional regulator
MKQIIVELDDETTRQLNKVAPPRSRKRSEFIRAAIRKALWEQEEQQTRAAYLAEPDDSDPVYFDPDAWER